MLMTSPEGMPITVPVSALNGDSADPGIVLVWKAWTSFTQPQSNSTVPPRLGSLTASTPRPLSQLAISTMATQWAPVRFATSQNYVEVSVPDSMLLTVNKEMKHDPSCGAMQWFKPFTKLAHSAMGVAEAHEYSGQGLGTKWSAPNKRSAFFGTFTY